MSVASRHSAHQKHDDIEYQKCRKAISEYWDAKYGNDELAWRTTRFYAFIHFENDFEFSFTKMAEWRTYNNLMPTWKPFTYHDCSLLFISKVFHIDGYRMKKEVSS